MNKVFDDITSYQRNEDDDYYYILGCNENSTTEQITCEYKSRVLSCHPDKHPHDETAHEKFSQLSQAKDTLLDPEKRKEYDTWRHSGIAIPFERWRSLSHVKTVTDRNHVALMSARNKEANRAYNVLVEKHVMNAEEPEWPKEAFILHRDFLADRALESMHWGFCKEQAAIDHPEAGDCQRRAVSPSRFSTHQDSNFQELKDKLRFTPRETSTGASNSSPKKGWERNTSNPLLHKFRNYEI